MVLRLLSLTTAAACIAVAQPFRGDLTGRVLDARTREAVPSANVVVVERPGAGASTDAEGGFRVRDLEVGTYSLRISAVGYRAKVVTNVVVTTGRAATVAVDLEEAAIEVGEVTASADYFGRAEAMSPVSANVVGRTDILRSPGGVQDVQRVVQSFPGVASSTDNINELIVRGGAPFENLTIMDQMEIPSINHYANQFNSAGPINMVNADMIEDAQFSTGGFPARYGDKASSVLDLTVREGDRSRGFASKTALNFAGVGTLLEGGLADGRGSYIFSVRYSTLEVLDAIFGLSTISLTAVPKYWDTQAKVVYDISPSQRLSLNGLYGDSRISIDGDPTGEDELRKNTVDSSSIAILYPRTKQYAVGLGLRSLFGRGGYSTLTVYSSGTLTDVTARSDYLERVRGTQGEVLSSRTLSSRDVYTQTSEETFAGAKYELFISPLAGHELALGVQVLTSLIWTNAVFVVGDTTRYDLNRDGTFEAGPVLVPEYRLSQALRFGQASKYYLFASDRVSLGSRLALTFGLRYDHFTFAGAGAWSPRASASFQIVPGASTLTVAVGRYPQTHPLPFYSDRRNIGYNRGLEPLSADHYVLGFQQIFGPGLKGSVEGYYKRYRRTAVREDFVYSAIDTFWSDRNLAIGRRDVVGLELLLEQKQVGDLFGTVSLSLSRSRELDPRQPPLTESYPSDYDYPVVLSAVGGKVVKGVRDWLNEAPFYIRYPSYLLPLSNEMELSFKYRYQTGRPTTPASYVTWEQRREGGVAWSKGAWLSTGDANGARYPDYSRLDLQLLSRFYLSSWNINFYLALMNVFNTKNVFYESRRSDGTVETVYQFAFFPVLGVEVEF